MKIKLLSFLLLLTVFCSAQDPRFSQAYAGPLHLNPALAGIFAGKFRFAANYREQWTSIVPNSPFRTIAAGLDMRFKIAGDDYFAIGLGALNDEAGDSYYHQLKTHITASYMKQLSGNRYRTSDQYLVFGVQAGMGQNSLNWSNLWFSRQFDTSIENVNTGLDNGEGQFDARTPLYPDFNAGLLYYALFDENSNIFVGAAMHHIIEPSISLMNNTSEKLYRRWVGNIGGELPLNNELSLLPGVIVMGQGKSMETVVGANFRYSNHDWREVALRFGPWVRFANKLNQGVNMDALIFSAMLEMERWNLGFSYDINTSSLSQATNSRGAVELSLIYIHPENQRIKTKCPKF
jgi:type IX secretion system PorP/SprF family membrane protein